MIMKAFVTGDSASTCTTHRDSTDSLLLVLRGSKVLMLKPPQAEVQAEAGYEHMSVETPLTGAGAVGRQDGWLEVRLESGEGFLLPKGWWHQVWSEPGTVALSLVLRLGAGEGQWQNHV